MNTKVKRMLEAMAIVMKDQDARIIRQLHEVINDVRDGYNFDFIQACESNKVWIKG